MFQAWKQACGSGGGEGGHATAVLGTDMVAVGDEVVLVVSVSAAFMDMAPAVLMNAMVRRVTGCLKTYISCLVVVWCRGCGAGGLVLRWCRKKMGGRKKEEENLYRIAYQSSLEPPRRATTDQCTSGERNELTPGEQLLDALRILLQRY